MEQFPFPKPLVLGHRGASKHAPENTIAAFRLAMESGADGIELDVQLTRDGQVVVMHDSQVDRTTQGRGCLADLTLAEIQGLDVRSIFGPVYLKERVPSLEQVFQALGSEPVYDLEIKNFFAPGNGLEKKVIALIHRYGLENRVLISSFNPASVRIFRRELPEAPAMLLLLGGAAGWVEIKMLGRWTSPGLVGLFHNELAGRLRSKLGDCQVMVWGPENPHEVRQAVQSGTIGIIVDDPGMARKALEPI